ncbi:ATP-binding protein, partial [Nakamurella sp.]|uniref:ATP-binding protein n=1 Tax=Nakamurella sp. TaxID=1869182 RepID=UPI003B3BE6BE
MTIRADPDRVQQVLLNLLNNAIKFTPRDGRIMLSAGCDESHGIIAVTDTGCGIPDR